MITRTASEAKLNSILDQIQSKCKIESINSFAALAIFADELSDFQIAKLKKHHIWEEVTEARKLISSEEFQLENGENLKDIRESMANPLFNMILLDTYSTFIIKEKETMQQNEVSLAIYLTEGLFPPKRLWIEDAEYYLHSPTFFRSQENPELPKLIMETAHLLAKEGKDIENFSDFQRDILLYLISGKSSIYAEPEPPRLPSHKILKPAQAIKEIENLTITQISLLQNCYYLGLKGDDLRAWRAGVEKNFSTAHEGAAELLIKNGTAPKAAIQQINGYTEQDALSLIREMEMRHQKTTYRVLN